jgi:hypothetical protein
MTSENNKSASLCEREFDTQEKTKVLIACEESQAVTIEFRKLGIEAYSCDLLPCSGGHKEWHIQDDVLNHLNDGWNMMIAFPPCTHLAVSGARWFLQKENEQQEALNFVRKLMDAQIDKICIENPISVISSKIRKPDQIIQPYMFGHEETKATCLWLKNLPLLKPSKIVEGKNHSVHKGCGYGWNTIECKMARSKTFSGIAKAMAEQWSKVI